MMLLICGVLAGAVGVQLRRQIRGQHSGRDRARPRHQPVRPARLAAGGRAADGRGRRRRGSDIRRVAVMFVDFRSFTAGARTRSPQEVVDRLDGAFAVLVEILDRHGGIVNKFLGDGFLALFGAPLEAPDAAHRAVAAAREMLAAKERVNEGDELAAAHRHRHPFRRGGRRQYRLAPAQGIYRDRRHREFCRRLEALNKEFDSQLLISAAVRDALGEDGSDAVSLGEVAVRGYDRPMAVWQIGIGRKLQMQRRYVTVDVFTDRAFGGNPLAVVLDAGGLSTAQMQAIATEFNYSETTFVLPPRDAANDAQVRIFTVEPRNSVRRPSQCRHRLCAGDAGGQAAGAAEVRGEARVWCRSRS